MALYDSTRQLQEENSQKFDKHPLYDRVVSDLKLDTTKLSTIGNLPGPTYAGDIHRSAARRLGALYNPIGVQEQLAQSQSGIEQLGYFFPRVAVKALSEVAQMPGYLGGAISWATTGFKPEEISRMVDNEWLKAVQSFEESTKEGLPVFVKEAVTNGSLLDNILSPAFWATEGADGVGFLLAMLAPGQAVRAAGVGTKMANLVGKTVNAAKYTDDVLATVFNTLFESAAEAGETYRNALDKIGDPQKAGEAAVNTLTKNFGLLLLSNALEQKMVFNAFSPVGASENATRRIAKNKALSRVLSEDGAKVLDEVKAVSRGTKWGQTIANLAKNSLREGFLEEGMQFAIGETSLKQAEEGDSTGFGQGLIDTLDMYFDSLSDTQMQKSILLGSLLGGGMSILQTRSERAQEDRLLSGTEDFTPTPFQKFLGKKPTTKAPGLHSLLKANYLSRVRSLQDIAETYPEGHPQEGEIVIDPQTGRYKIDFDKALAGGHDFLAKALLRTRMYDAMRNNEGELASYLKHKLDADYILPFLQVEGGLDVLKVHLEQLAQTDAQTLKEEGVISDPEVIKNELIAKAERMDKIYRRVEQTNPFNIKVKRNKEDADTYKEFVDLVKYNKLSLNFSIDNSTHRIGKLLDELANYKASGVSVPITATTDIYGPELVSELKESLKEQDSKLTEVDKNFIATQIKFIEGHNEVLAEDKKSLKELYDNKVLQKKYDELFQIKEEQKKAAQDAAGETIKNAEKSQLSPALQGLYDEAVIKEPTVLADGRSGVITHSGDVELSFTAADGTTNKHKVSILNSTQNGNLAVRVKEITEVNTEGQDVITPITSQAVHFLNSDGTYQYRGESYTVTDINITKSAEEVKQEAEVKALFNAINSLIELQKTHIAQAEGRIQSAHSHIEYLMGKAEELAKKELASLKQTGSLLTKKGTSRVQLTKVITNKGKNVANMFLTLDQILQEVANAQRAITTLQTNTELYNRRLQALELERKRLESDGFAYTKKLKTIQARMAQISEETAKSLDLANSGQMLTSRYLQKLRNLLNGYYTTATKILNLDAEVDAIRSNPELSIEEKLSKVGDLIARTIAEKKNLTSKEYLRLGAGKMLSPTQWKNLGKQIANLDVETIKQLGTLPDNIRKLEERIAEEERILKEITKEQVRLTQYNLEVQTLAESKAALLAKIKSEYIKLAQESGALFISNKSFIPTPEDNYDNLHTAESAYISTFEKNFQRPFTGVDSWFSSQGNQDFAVSNPDVARWYVFVNNHAYRKDEDGKSIYTAKSFTFTQVGQLEPTNAIRAQLRFYTGKADNRLLTYDEIVEAFGTNIPAEVQEDIKMVIHRRKDNNPVFTSPAGFLTGDGRKHILFTSFAAPSYLTSGNFERFSTRKMEESFIRETFKTNNPTADQIATAKLHVQGLLKASLEEYQRYRDEVLKINSVSFDISSINPGIKQLDGAQELEVMEGLGLKNIKELTKGRLQIISTKDTSKLYDESDEGRTQRYASGTPFGLVNGYLYILVNNRWEVVKPKTFGDTNSVKSIIDLIKFAMDNIGTEEGLAVEQYLKTIIYTSNNAASKYQFQFKNPYIDGKFQKTGIVGLSFGNLTMKRDDLNDPTKVLELEKFLENKYWNFNRKALRAESFIEYKIKTVDGQSTLVSEEWSADKGSYVGFLFNPTKTNKSKGTVFMRKVDQPTPLKLAKDPQYKNQSLNLVRPGIKKAPKATEGTSSTKSTTKRGIADLQKTTTTESTQATSPSTSTKKKGIGGLPKLSSATETVPPTTLGTPKIQKENAPISSDPGPAILDSVFAPPPAVPSQTVLDSNTPEEADQETIAVPWEKLTDEHKDLLIELFGNEADAKAQYLSQQGSDSGSLNRAVTAQDNYEREHIDSMVTWFKQKFPDFPIHVIDGLINNKSWGSLVDGSIVLISNLAASGTVYHEAWHVFSQIFLTDTQQKELYDSVRSSQKNTELTNKEVEEFLAEEFRTFMTYPETYRFGKTKAEQLKKSWFQKFLDWILQILGISNTTESLVTKYFTQLSDGRFELSDRENTTNESFDRIGELPEKQSYLYLRDINYLFFDVLFSNKYGATAIFNLDSTLNDLYKEVKARYINDAFLKKNTTHYKTIIDNWDALIKEHRRFVKQYRIDIPAITEEEDLQRDTYSYKESLEVNLTDLIPSAVRVVLASIPSVIKVGSSYKLSLSEYQMRSTTAFNKLINTLKGQLAGSTSIADMNTRLQSLESKKPELAILRHRLALDKDSLSKDEFILQNAFYKAFALTQANPLISQISPDGERHFFNAASDSNSKLIKNSWVNNAIALIANNATPLITMGQNNTYLLNKKAIISAIDSLTALEPTSSDRASAAVDILASLGIQVFPANTTVYNTKVLEEYLLRLREDLLTNTNPSLEVLDLYDGTIIKNQKELEELVSLTSRFFLNDTDLMYYNHEKNPEYPITLNSHISNTVNVLNQITNYDGELSIPDSIRHLQPYNGKQGNLFNTNGRWWSSILNGNQLELVILKGQKSIKRDGADLQSSSLGDYKSISFHALLDGIIPLLRAADRKLEYGFKIGTPHTNITRVAFKQMMVDYLKDELLTSFAYFSNPNKWGNSLLHYRDNVKSLRAFDFLYNPDYTPARRRKKPLSLEDFYSLHGSDTTLSGTKELDNLNSVVSRYLSEYKDYISDSMDMYLDALTNTTLQSLLDDHILYLRQYELKNGGTVDYYFAPGISSETLDKHSISLNTFGALDSESVSRLIQTALYNQYIGVTEQLKLFLGDLAMYKSPVDFHKRVTGAASTKYSTANDPFVNSTLDELFPRVDGKTRTGEVDQIILQDVIVSNTALGNEFAEYKKINAVDGQSWMLLDEYRDFMIRSGVWEDRHERTYQYEMQSLVLRLLDLQKKGKTFHFKVSEDMFTDEGGVFYKHTNGVLPKVPLYNGYQIKEEDLGALTILKPQGFGSISNVDGLHATQFFKTSTAPIFPSALSSESKLFDFITYMMANQADVLTFESAHKGTILINDDGSIPTLESDEFNIQSLRYEDFGIQLDVHEETDGSVTFSTQRNRLEFRNLFNLGSFVGTNEQLLENQRRYESLMNSMTVSDRNRLLDRLGITYNEASGLYSLSDTNVKKFTDTITELYETRLMPKNTIDIIELILNSEHKSFDMTTTSNKIEELILSLIKNGIISRKVTGEMLIQESSYLYDTDLKFYRKEGNKVLPMQVMISLPKSWIPFVNKIGGLAAFNEAIKTKNTKILSSEFLNALVLPSVRIPGQGLNSLEAMEVVRFMPFYHGNKVVLPADIAVKSGSDYDVDKLTTYINNFKVVGTNEPIPLKDNQNELIELLNTSLLQPERFKELITPNTSKTLKALAKESQNTRALSQIERLSINPQWASTLEWWYNIQKGYEFWTSKAGVAVTAIQNTAHALEQQYPLQLTGLIPIYFSGQEHNESPETQHSRFIYQTGFIKDADGRFIGDNFSEFLTAFVDAAKDAFVFELVDTYVFNAFAALNRIGVANNGSVGLSAIAKAFTSDIVKDYLQIRRANMNSHMFDNRYNDEKLYKGTFGGRWSNTVRLNREQWYEQAVKNAIQKSGIPASEIKNVPFSYEGTLTNTIEKILNIEGETPQELLQEYARKVQAYNYKYLSKQDLATNNLAKHPELQIQLLDNVLSYILLGRKLSSVNNILRPDAKSAMPKHYTGILSQQVTRYSQGIPKIFDIGSIENTLGNSLIAEQHKTKEEIPNMLQWSSALLSDNTVKSYFENLALYYNNRVFGLKAQDKDKVLNDIKSQFFTFMLIDSLQGSKEDLEQLYKYLFTGNNSIPQQLLQYKKKYPGNLGLSELDPIIGYKLHRTKMVIPIDTISTFGKNHDVHQKDAIESDIYTLWESNTPEARRFVEHLLFHSLLQNGMQNSYNSYLELIPNRIFISLINKTMERLNALDESAKQDLLAVFTDQIARNNASNRQIVAKYPFLGRGKLTFEDKKNYYDGINYVSHNVSLGGRDSGTVVYLYKRIPHTNTFNLATKLGEHTKFLEFYPMVDLSGPPTSILETNTYKYRTAQDSYHGRKPATAVDMASESEFTPEELDIINSEMQMASKVSKGYRGKESLSPDKEELFGINKYLPLLDNKITVNQLIDKIARTSEDSSHRLLAQAIQKGLSKLGVIDIRKAYDSELDKGFTAVYRFAEGHKYKHVVFDPRINTDSFEMAMLHEALHGLTMGAYYNNPAFRSQMNELYNHVVNYNPKYKQLWSKLVIDPLELISYGLTDPYLQRILARTPGLNEDGMKISSESALNQFINSIIEWLQKLFSKLNITTIEDTALENLLALSEPYITGVVEDNSIVVSSRDYVRQMPDLMNNRAIINDLSPKEEVINFNVKELNKESNEVDIYTEVLENFDKYFPKESEYMNETEKIAFIDALSNGDMEIICGL